MHNSTDVNQIPEQQQQQGPPTKKGRKQAVRVVKVTSRDLFRLVGQDNHNTIKLCKPKAYPLHKNSQRSWSWRVL